jgi:hypothetical protein
MGWGITFNAEIYLSRQEYSTKYAIEDKIKEIEESINNHEATLKMYASATPKDIVPEEFSEEPISWLNIQINEVLEIFKEDLIQKYQLGLYLEHLIEKEEAEKEAKDKQLKLEI